MDLNSNLKNDFLRLHLQMAVKWRIEQLKHHHPDVILDNIDLYSNQWLQIVVSQGDLLLFKSSTKGETSKVFNTVVEAVAHLAFAPGGVDYLGLKFEANPHQPNPSSSKTETSSSQ